MTTPAPAPAGAPAPPPDPFEMDRIFLMQALAVLFGVKSECFLASTDPRYEFNEMWEALRGAGITMFTREFLLVPHEQIIELKTSSAAHATTYDRNLSITAQARFRIMRA